MKNPEAVKKWLEALRSGKFKQGRKRLKPGTKHCCLGVLCEVARKEGVPLPEGWEGWRGLPMSVMNWSGVRTDTGAFNRTDHLSNRNDGGDTFLQIADLIESEPEGLFE